MHQRKTRHFIARFFGEPFMALQTFLKSVIKAIFLKSLILLINDEGNLSRTKKSSAVSFSNRESLCIPTYQVLFFSWFHSACSTVGSGCSQGMKNILQWKRHIDSYGTTPFYWKRNSEVAFKFTGTNILRSSKTFNSPPFLYFLHNLVVFFGGLNAFNYTFTIRRALK